MGVSFNNALHRSSVESQRTYNSIHNKFKILYDFSGVNVPASMKDVAKFEKQNSSKSFSINVFGTYKEFGENLLNVKLMLKTIRDKSRKVVDLLYVEEAELDFWGNTIVTSILCVTIVFAFLLLHPTFLTMKKCALSTNLKRLLTLLKSGMD
jgi:hypothetical protein